MSTDDYDRMEIDQPKPGRLRRIWDTLQDTVSQQAQSVARQASFNVIGGNVEDVDPPEDIGEYVDLYYDEGAIRKNINEFVDDVTAPGLSVESDHDPTQDYFMGGDAAPEGAPDGGFLDECFVFDETRQPFGKGLEISVRDRWVRGTVLVELIKADVDDSESIISGFKFIRPETVSARTYPNTVQLIQPDDTENADKLTPRGEAAAYVQFDETSILARRLKRRDKQQNRNQFESSAFADQEQWKALSQNDVLKLVLNQDIGGSDPEAGVFGESIIRTIDETATEYANIKRNLTKAVQGKAWGLWTLQMNDYVLDAGDQQIIVEWDDADIDSTTTEAEDMGPGSMLSTDAKIDLNRHDGEVPDLEWVLRQYKKDIVDPLPAPFYKHSQADEINQFVTGDQQEDYQDLIKAEREYQASQWQAAFRRVARRHDELQADGLTVSIEPDQDASPILSLSNEEIERIATWMNAATTAAGPTLGPSSIVDEEVLRELILQLPEDAGSEDVDTMLHDRELDPDTERDVREQFNAIVGGDD